MVQYETAVLFNNPINYFKRCLNYLKLHPCFENLFLFKAKETHKINLNSVVNNFIAAILLLFTEL